MTAAGHAESEYHDYVESEWRLFADDQRRQQPPLLGGEEITVRRVLDVGCGGGQEMIPFGQRGAGCVGVDISPDSGRFGRQLFRRDHPGLRVSFATAMAEGLPFGAGTFDVVICRVAIPYTNNRLALAEMARVLRPGGVLILKVHHARYYVRKFFDGIRTRSPLFAVHAARVLVSGAIFQALGRQPRGGLLLKECYLTESVLRRELRGSGLTIEGELPDSNPLTPAYQIRKR